jgi:glycosyltransferase involved in cell wall biosynthesis
VNVLFLNSSRRRGGTEKWVSLAVRSLSGKVDVFLACRNPALWSGLPVRPIRLPFLFEADAATIVRLVRLILSRRIHVLVPTKRKDYALAGIASRLSGARNVLRLGIVRKLGDRWYNRLIYRAWADGIVVNAEKIKSALVESPFIVPESVRVIYNGVDAESVRRKSEESVPALPEFSFALASMGELSQRKGMDLLIRGFSEFLHRIPNEEKTGLVLIGEGSERSELERLAQKLGIAGAVFFAGFQENPYPYLKACDLFVMTSKNEGISNALLEAMALGKPVLATAAGGTDELIRHRENGILIDDPSPESLGEALADLYMDVQKRERIAENGYKTVVEFCSLDRMRDELLDFFKQTVHPQRVRPFTQRHEGAKVQR